MVEAAVSANVLRLPGVLLVDDRLERRRVMRLVIESGAHGRTVVAEAESAAGAVAALDRSAVDAAVVEIQMPIDAGVAAVAALRAARPSLAIVVCTFHGDRSTRERVLAAGADDYLIKPVSARQIQAACRGRGAEGRADTGRQRIPQMAS